MPPDLQKEMRFPWTERINVPDDVRERLRDAVKTVTKRGRRRLLKEDENGFIDAIEGAVGRYLHKRGRWARGPYGRIPPLVARDAKPRPTKTTYTKPLEKVATQLEDIFRQLELLPIECIDHVEAASSAYLRQQGVCDKYPTTEPFSEREPRGSGFVCDPNPAQRYRFLLRLEALSHGVKYAKERIEDFFSENASAERNSDVSGEVEARKPTTKPKDYDTFNLIFEIAYSYLTHLGKRPTTDGRGNNTPFQRLLVALFDWLRSAHGVRELGPDRLRQYAQKAVRQIPKSDCHPLSG